jgi:hypothetical protein
MVVTKQSSQLRRYATMKEHNVVALSGRESVRDELTELIREGARKLIAEGLEAEVGELLATMSARRDAGGRAAVARNGSQPERAIQTRGCVTRDSLLHMMFKLGECAEQNWRKLRGFKYLAKIIEDVKICRWRRDRATRPGRRLISSAYTRFDYSSIICFAVSMPGNRPY